jgi:O-antigen/teichoic acid export membrane protein
MWVLVGSLVSYGSLLDFGIASAITKYVAEFRARGDYEESHRLVATALWLYTASGLVAIILGAIFAPISPYLFNVPPEQTTIFSWLVFLSGVGLGISLPCATTIAVLRGLQRFDLINVIGICGMLLYGVATVIVLLLGGGLLGMAVVSILVNLFMQIPAVWLIRRNAPLLHFGWCGARRSYLHTVASFSSALFVINIAGQLQTKTDEIVIGIALPVSNVTPYSIAHRLSELPQMLTDQFMKLIMPLASQLHSENDQGRLRQLYIISTRLTLASFLPLGLGVIILAKPFLTAWVGVAYAPYSGLVVLLIIASLMDTLMWPASAILQGIFRHRLLALSALASGLANLALSIVLVRPLGLAGVALGTLIPTTIESLFFVIPYTLRIVGIDLRTSLKKMFLPALVPAVLMVFVLTGLRELLRPTSIISILAIGGAGFVVYSLAYLSMSASSQERRMFLDLARKELRSGRQRLRPGSPDVER